MHLYIYLMMGSLKRMLNVLVIPHAYRLIQNQAKNEIVNLLAKVNSLIVS